MKVLITGTSGGIGRGIAEKFLRENHSVIGFDILEGTIENENYTHCVCDVLSEEIPDIDGVNILINNAGVQNTGRDIDINLKGAINITEKYGFQNSIKSILFIASSSARTGSEFPEYAASKGGMVAYMKNVAGRIAKFVATANSLSPGGVKTKLNEHILNDENLYEQVLNETMLHRWASVSEIADWAYFITVNNMSMTAQDILVDNGEADKSNFIW